MIDGKNFVPWQDHVNGNFLLYNPSFYLLTKTTSILYSIEVNLINSTTQSCLKRGEMEK